MKLLCICTFRIIRPAREEVWVFGIVDTQYMPALGYMEIVDSRDAATLLPIIRDHVQSGSIIHSDQWASYSRVSSIPGVAAHHTVNHSIELVDSTTGVHTQNVLE